MILLVCNIHELFGSMSVKNNEQFALQITSRSELSSALWNAASS